MQAKPFAILSAVLTLLFVIDLIRRRRLSFKYSILWMLACGAALVFAVNDHWITAISRIAGFTLPSNFIYFLLLIFAILGSLTATLQISEQNQRTEALAQSISTLQFQIQKLKERPQVKGEGAESSAK